LFSSTSADGVWNPKPRRRGAYGIIIIVAALDAE
jgi:hypothetical protein